MRSRNVPGTRKISSASALPDEMTSIIEDVGFIDSIPLWAVTLLGSLFIWVLALVMICTRHVDWYQLSSRPERGPKPDAPQQS